MKLDEERGREDLGDIKGRERIQLKYKLAFK